MSARGRMKRKQDNPQRHIAPELDEPPLVRPESPEEVGARMDREARDIQEQKKQGRQRQHRRTRSQAVDRARLLTNQYNEELTRRARVRAVRVYEATRQALDYSERFLARHEALEVRSEAMKRLTLVQSCAVDYQWFVDMYPQEGPWRLELVPRLHLELSAEAQAVWQTGGRPARHGRIDGLQRPVAWIGEESGPVEEPVADQAEEPSDAEVQANEEEEA